MKDSVFMVTEFYTPYKHNGATEDNNITLFSSQNQAIRYIRGTDGKHLLKPDKMVNIWLKEGCKPEYELDSDPFGIAFLVKESCISDQAIKEGGYVYRITLREVEVQ